MKKLKIILTGAAILFLSIGVMAQGPPPPPAGGHGQTGDKDPGGGAPIGSGIVILLSLGAAYGGKKIYDMKQEDLVE